jgi:hypothetical protein
MDYRNVSRMWGFGLLTIAVVVGTVVVVTMTFSSPVRAAQKGGGGGGGMLGAGNVQDAVMGSTNARVLTPFEQFADKLKLDQKTQVAPVQEVFVAAQTEAGRPGVEMLQLRQKLLRIDLGELSEDRKAVLDAYTAAALKMSGIEARTFAKVYEMLKPNQRSNAGPAFALMTGFFQPSGAPGGGRGGRR